MTFSQSPIHKFALFILLISSFQAFSQGGRIQTRPKNPDAEPMEKPERERTEMVTFKDHLWYGGSFDLGFSGGNGYNQFILGINPMVGYKILPFLSVGPRAGIQYNYLKGYFVSPNAPSKVSLWNFSAGVFTRAKFFKNFFAQAEYEYQNYQGFYSNNLEKFRVGRDNMYIGAGYNSGGIFASEISLMYNLLESADSYELPFSLRFGLTYNF